MMEKKFDIYYPDEPYKDTFQLGKKVEAVYQGYKYLAITVQEKTNIVEYVVGGSENLEDINLENFSGVPNVRHTIFDAEKNPLEASFLTHNYYHDKIDPYSYTLPDGTVWEYNYSDKILDEIYQLNTLLYDIDSSTFTSPKVNKHPLSKEEFFGDLSKYIERINSNLQKPGKYSTVEIQQLMDHIKWVESLTTVYKDVDHWKISWPSDLPDF